MRAALPKYRHGRVVFGSAFVACSRHFVRGGRDVVIQLHSTGYVTKRFAYKAYLDPNRTQVVPCRSTSTEQTAQAKDHREQSKGRSPLSQNHFSGFRAEI